MAEAKKALIQTGIVLGVIFLLNQFAPTKNVVQKALQG